MPTLFEHGSSHSATYYYSVIPPTGGVAGEVIRIDYTGELHHYYLTYSYKVSTDFMSRDFDNFHFKFLDSALSDNEKLALVLKYGEPCLDYSLVPDEIMDRLSNADNIP